MSDLRKIADDYFELNNETEKVYFGRSKHDYFFDFEDVLRKNNITFEDIKNHKAIVVFRIDKKNELYAPFKNWHNKLHELLVKDIVNRSASQHYLDDDGDIVIESSDGDTYFTNGEKPYCNYLTILDNENSISLMFTGANANKSVRIDSVGCGKYEEYLPTHMLLEDLNELKKTKTSNIIKK